MIAYAATVIGFWICVTVWTLFGCWLVDAVTSYVGRCRDRRRRYLTRIAQVPAQRVGR